MKITDLAINKTYEIRDRNKSIVIDSSLIVAPEIYLTANREVVAVDNGILVKIPEHTERQYNFTQRLSTLVNRVVTLPAEYGGVSITVGQLAAAIEILTDELADEFNNPVIVTTPVDTTPPDAPQNVIAIGISATEIAISWDNVADAVSYMIYRDGEHAGSIDTNEYIDTELTPNTTYAYIIKSIDAANNVSEASITEEGSTLS